MNSIVASETHTGEVLNLQYERSTRQFMINGAVVKLLPLRATAHEYLFEKRSPLFPGLYHVSATAVQRLLAADERTDSALSNF